MGRIVFIFVLLTLVALLRRIHADPFYERYHLLKYIDSSIIKVTCTPGRTVIKYEEIQKPSKNIDSDEEEDYGEIEDFGRRNKINGHERFRRRYTDEQMLRYHMNFAKESAKDGNCKMCVCSAEGKDEHCSARPAINFNECLRMRAITEQHGKYLPFSHDRDLSQMIRRDYIWHRDEIPYEYDAKCYRGTSFYSNDPKAEQGGIDFGSDVESLIGYENDTICFYCICSVGGEGLGCIPRDTYFCDYLRMLDRGDDPMRDVYTNLFGEDRPTYFRTLAQRMRRTMDEGVYDLIANGGDTLCCEHHSGHRRTLHTNVKKRVWDNMRRKVPRENLLAGPHGALNGDYVDFIVNNDKKK